MGCPPSFPLPPHFAKVFLLPPPSSVLLFLSLFTPPGTQSKLFIIQGDCRRRRRRRRRGLLKKALLSPLGIAEEKEKGFTILLSLFSPPLKRGSSAQRCYLGGSVSPPLRSRVPLPPSPRNRRPNWFGCSSYFFPGPPSCEEKEEEAQLAPKGATGKVVIRPRKGI